MKIAFSTSGASLDAPLDERFGRAPNFLVYETEGGTFEVIENAEGADAAQGAGIQAAQSVARAGAGIVVTGHCGPKAFRVLAAAGIEVYPSSAATVAEALDLFLAGKLSRVQSADVNGHWA